MGGLRHEIEESVARNRQARCALAAEGRLTDAAHLWGVSDEVLGSVGGALSPEIRWIRERSMGPVKQSLGVEKFADACDEERAMPVDCTCA